MSEVRARNNCLVLIYLTELLISEMGIKNSSFGGFLKKISGRYPNGDINGDLKLRKRFELLLSV